MTEPHYMHSIGVPYNKSAQGCTARKLAYVLDNRSSGRQRRQKCARRTSGAACGPIWEPQQRTLKASKIPPGNTCQPPCRPYIQKKVARVPLRCFLMNIVAYATILFNPSVVQIRACKLPCRVHAYPHSEHRVEIACAEVVQLNFFVMLFSSEILGKLIIIRVLRKQDLPRTSTPPPPQSSWSY